MLTALKTPLKKESLEKLKDNREANTRTLEEIVACDTRYSRQ